MPHFLFSYAQYDWDSYAEEFYTDLRTEVRVLLGGPLREAGFIDYGDIDLSADWSAELIDALSTCHVMVALYSPSYFQRPNCGKEWAVMAQRIDLFHTMHKTDAPNILPVLWVPSPMMPDVAVARQWRPPGFHDSYVKHGLRDLVRTKNGVDLELRYKEVVRGLATRIRDLALAPQPLPAPPVRPSWDTVEPAFPVVPAAPLPAGLSAADALPPADAVPPAAAVHDGGPRNVHVVVVAGSRDELATVRRRLDYYGVAAHDWAPFHPVHPQKLSAYAVQLIGRKNIIPYLEPPGRALCDVLEEAGRANEVVVILLDAWTAGVSPYRDELRKYDDRNEVTAVVMIPQNKDDDEAAARAIDLAALLKQAMPKNVTRRDVLFRHGSATLEAFRRDMWRAVLEAQNRCFALATVPRSFPVDGPAERPRLVGP